MDGIPKYATATDANACHSVINPIFLIRDSINRKSNSVR